jgi:hypothetical protein
MVLLKGNFLHVRSNVVYYLKCQGDIIQEVPLNQNHQTQKKGPNLSIPYCLLTFQIVNNIDLTSNNFHRSLSFQQFQQLSCEAYLIIRKNAYLFINLVTMMVSCGITELQSLDDSILVAYHH